MTPEKPTDRDHWAQVDLAGDRNPPIRLFPRQWRKGGDGTRFERGRVG